jgi:hypothetical protein
MRPVRTAVFVSAAAFAVAIAVTGCTADSTVLDPRAAAPAAPAVTMPKAIPAIPAIPAAPAAPAVRIAPARQAAPATHSRPTTPTAPAAPGRLYFGTPQAAMRYLAAAYNRNDLVALGHVTTPTARANLVAMRRTAVNLQLVGCAANPGRGDFACSFTHDYPASLHLSGNGHAHFTAAPADKHGWYMTVLDDCS